MTLFILSFVAGILTVAAPCILPLLPVVIGGSLVDDGKQKPDRRWVRPVVIAASLAASVVAFTLLIKATTALLGIPQLVWQIIAGSIVILLGMSFLWPHGWEKLSSGSGFFNKSNALLGKAYRHNGIFGAVLIGAALGPVFSSCSPTYALIVATVLPASFMQGLLYLVAYAAGMSLTLLAVAFAGQRVLDRLKILSNPNGWFKRSIGILFILTGIFVMTGLDKRLQSFILDQGWYNPISNLEQQLRR